jgi:hypothetical protein
VNKPNQSITGITEIALRVHDLDLMRSFYEQVIGLEVLGESAPSDGSTAIFFAVGAGNSHLALFPEKLTGWYTRDKSPQIDPKLTTILPLLLRSKILSPKENGSSSSALRSWNQELRAGCTVGCFTFSIPKGT